MIRIEITRHDDKAKEIIHYNIFAWLRWPLELIESGCRYLAEQIKLAVTGSCVVITGGWVKEQFVPSGGLDKPFSNRALRTTTLKPHRTVTRYEDRADYRRAIEKGIGSTMLCSGQARLRSKNEQ